MRIRDFAKANLFYSNVKNSMKSNINNNKKRVLDTQDTITISNEARKKLNLNKRSSINTSVDASINVDDYIKKVDNENKKTIENAGNEVKAQVQYKDEYYAYEEMLNKKYSRLVNIAKEQSSPEQYISDKYLNKNSPYYQWNLSDEERQAGYRNEINMLNYGQVTEVDFRDSLFRGLSSPEDRLNISRKDFDRQIVNNQVKNILNNSGIKLNDDVVLNLSINPYSYNINVTGKAEDHVLNNIKSILESGKNSEELFKHIIIASLDNDHNNKKITKEGRLKYDLYHQCMDFTGIDIRELDERDGSYFDKNGNDIIDSYNKAVDDSVRNEENKIPENDCGHYKKWFSDMVHESSNKGWNNMNDMVLDINLTSHGLVDSENY